MTSIDSLKEIRILKQNERQKISLVKGNDGKRYLKREINGDKREIYKVLQKINHPNIPKIYSVELTDKTIVVEEYIEGESLSAIMKQNIKISQTQIYSVSKQVLSALEKLHSERIIHRDVKPDNILMDKSNHVWLIDYDIARIYREELRKDTESMGTFGYAPIEQFGMLPTDFKTDIYSFGVTLKTLLDYSKNKGFLYKIADKCKRLDPGQRYESAKEVQKAIAHGRTKIPLISIITIAAVIFALLAIWGISNYSQEISESKDESGLFLGFADGINEEEYRKYPTFSYVAVFSIDEPWEHLLFLDDMDKKGKIRLGENNTKINADISLNNGTLSVSLDDKLGHKFSHTFKFDDQYSYNKSYTEKLRRNADIICRDLDYDDIPELLIGLNEGAIGIIDNQFYNNFNYCIAWCIKYDEDKGFTLCEGDMFSEGYSFTLNRYTNKLNISWYNFGDITGYHLEGDKIEPVY